MESEILCPACKTRMLYGKNGLVCTITHQKTYEWQHNAISVCIKNPFDDCHVPKYIVRPPHFQLERLKPNTESVLQNLYRNSTPVNSSHLNRHSGILAQKENCVKQEFPKSKQTGIHAAQTNKMY